MSLLLRNGQVCSSSKIRFKYRSVQARHRFICIQATTAALYEVKIFARSSQQISQISVLSQLRGLRCGPAWACRGEERGHLHKPVKNWAEHQCYCSQLHKNTAVQYGNESQVMPFAYYLGINTNPLRIGRWTLSTLRSPEPLWSSVWYLFGLMFPLASAQT